jgi:hypothetical protein
MDIDRCVNKFDKIVQKQRGQSQFNTIEAIERRLQN